jgi:hypothetical protein
MSTKIQGGSNTAGVANVDVNYQLKTVTETDAYTNGNYVGAVRSFGEVDGGYLTGAVKLKPIEIDNDYRQRISQDFLVDEENFNYTAQNTGKHNLATTTMTAAFTAGQLTLNSGSITTITTGAVLSTYAYAPIIGTTTMSLDTELGFSAQPAANVFVEWGIGIAGAQTVAPTDGIFFRLNSAGLQGISSFNGTEVSTGIFPLIAGTGTWAYTNDKRYQFICYQSTVEAIFWVNDGTGAVMLGSIQLPAGQSRMSMSSAGQVFFKQRITGGAAGGVLQTKIGAYSLRIGGINFSTLPSTSGNRMFGSYQGLSGGTMGSLANYANSANPTAAVPTNTTAALGTGLGGQFWETDTLAVTTDGIISSFQVPAATVNISGRRLCIRFVKIQSYCQTALTGGGYVAQWSLAFGHTAVSLATAEAATTKAPRRVTLGIHGVPSALAVNSTLGDIVMDFGDAPVFVNPSEFVQVVKKKVGTAPTAGVIGHMITITYGWE